MIGDIDMAYIGCQAKLMNKLRDLAVPCAFLSCMEDVFDTDPQLLAVAKAVTELFKKDPDVGAKMAEIMGL